MELGDCIDEIKGGRHDDFAKRRKLRVRMYVLADVVKRGRISGHCWYVLEYDKVDRIDVNYPGDLELFPIGFDSNLGDWGYDELTCPKKNHFRHEILFASGATITIDFRDFTFRRMPAKN